MRICPTCSAPPPAAPSPQLLVSLANGQLVALSEETGAVLWTLDTGAPLLSSANPAAAAAGKAGGGDGEEAPGAEGLKEGIFPGSDGSLYVYSVAEDGSPRIEVSKQ